MSYIRPASDFAYVDPDIYVQEHPEFLKGPCMYVFPSRGEGDTVFVEDYGWLRELRTKTELSVYDRAQLLELTARIIKRELDYDTEYAEQLIGQLRHAIMPGVK